MAGQKVNGTPPSPVAMDDFSAAEANYPLAVLTMRILRDQNASVARELVRRTRLTHAQVNAELCARLSPRA